MTRRSAVASSAALAALAALTLIIAEVIDEADIGHGSTLRADVPISKKSEQLSQRFVALGAARARHKQQKHHPRFAGSSAWQTAERLTKR